MTDLTFKKIDKKDKTKVLNLIDNVLKDTKPEYFIPYEKWELEKLFDESYAPLHGAYDGDKLVGIAQLYVDQNMLSEFKNVLGIQNSNACELGGDLVLKDYRGQGIMYSLIKIQYELAKNMGFEYIFSMAHPDNISSLKSLEKLGLEFVKQATVSNGFLRNICIKKLK